MGDKPGQYWDHRECGWVRHDARAQPDRAAALVPSQKQLADAAAVSGLAAVAEPAEADVRSG